MWSIFGRAWASSRTHGGILKAYISATDKEFVDV